MAGPLLETKLHVPTPRRGRVTRHRLDERLSLGAESALTLVSAPAGFGKTTLLAQWLASAPVDGRSTAWLSLDQRDNDPTVFWTYVVTALKAAESGVGSAALSLLQAPPAPIDAVLATLLNDLQAVPNDVVLVLDDYHVIDSRDVHDAMAFLLEHLPPQVHLVIAGRADPQLPLARLRGRGELVEVRAADLRFTPDEAAAYLNGVMGLALTASDVTALEERTEGWIAALQLAALSMQGRDDVTAFIAGFAGDDRYIVDYLAEEVLQRQPEDVRTFLLQTSVLDRMSGPLCDAVTGQDGGKAKLEALERGNLFLVPLDERRRWYRYHQLFADVLHAHLLDEQPDEVAHLHSRASAWCEQNGEPGEAIRHALAAEDFERAADLVERAWPVMRSSRQEATLLRWLSALPDTVLRRRPVLSLAYGGALLTSGVLDGVETRLLDAERWLDPTTDVTAAATGPATAMVVRDADEFRRLPAAIAMHRAAFALATGDLSATASYASRVGDLTSDGDHVERGGAAGLMGLAHWASGDLEAGHRMYAECMASLQRAGFIADIHGCALAMADIRITQGRLRDAMRTFEQALAVTSAAGGPVLRGTVDMHIGMSELCREHDDLRAATAHLLQGQQLGEHLGLPQSRYRWRAAMARVREAEGDLDGAIDLLDQAERWYVGDFFPNVRPVPAVQARVRIAQGNLVAARAWASERGLSADDDLSYLREYEHITLARLLLAASRYGRTERSLDGPTELLERLLERLLAAAEAGDRNGSIIEILLLQALASQSLGDVATGLVPLERALTLAEPEGYVRVFVDEGPPMSVLLEAAAQRAIAPNYVRRLLSALDEGAGSPPARPALIEPLSDRELAVLRLLRTDLGGPDIARELVVSLHTVRSHTKKIYAKLEVNNRRSAVRRAEELDLLP